MTVENELTEVHVIDDFVCYCFGKTLKKHNGLQKTQ